MVSTTGITGSGDPDMALIGELLEDISRNPPAIGARKLLVEHYISIGWLDAAMDYAKDLKNLAPRDSDVTQYLVVLQKKPEPPEPVTKTMSVQSGGGTEARVWDPRTGRYKKTALTKTTKNAPEASPIQMHSDLEPARHDLIQGYQALRTRARFVLADLLNLQTLQKKACLPPSKNTATVKKIAASCDSTPSTKSSPPSSARSVARRIRDSPSEATSLAISDLEDTMLWIREPHGKSSGADDDAVRDVLVKRCEAVQSALPENLKVHCELALMHLEHEHLKRNYCNTETMLGDGVDDIPRTHFYVTEDNFAWDMSELVQAIAVGKGIMRNPLSKEMFTQKDVKGILLHPLGKPLAALAVEQNELSKGVRMETINQMEKLSRILLEDQTSDTLPSRKAVDEFLAYIATLPDFEQQAIEHLKCPAKDSHTGQSYDFSIGEAVRDAKGNRVCFHKTGDFVQQAATHLRQNQGGPADPDKCCVM